MTLSVPFYRCHFNTTPVIKKEGMKRANLPTKEWLSFHPQGEGPGSCDFWLYRSCGVECVVLRRYDTLSMDIFREGNVLILMGR